MKKFDENVRWKCLMKKADEQVWWKRLMNKLYENFDENFKQKGQWKIDKLFEEWVWWKWSMNKFNTNVWGINSMKNVNG